MEIVNLRQAHPTWGPKKLRAVMLRTRAPEEVPSARTIGRVLERAGLVAFRRQRRRRRGGEVARPGVLVVKPNDVWTVDFKGWWRTRDSKKCEPLTIRDAHSRYLLAIEVLPSTSYDHARAVFEQVFRDYGMPDVMLSDNGSPFANTQALKGLTRLSAWWVALGIRVVRSRVGCPQDNGGHERMHRDMAKELERFPARTIPEQQRACDRWRHEFNEHRPHESLGMKSPADVYRRSFKLFPEAPLALVYPEHMESRLISSAGTMRYAGKQRFLARGLAGHRVGVEPLPENRFKVWFADICLGVGRLPWTAPLVPFEEEEGLPQSTSNPQQPEARSVTQTG